MAAGILKNKKFESHLLCCFVGLFDEISGRQVFGEGDYFPFFFFKNFLSFTREKKGEGW